ncbi:MAG TPA: DinB family protein [Blastocatellia bacterium]|nr:DinB family protein [Blastocatellia bacterium]
MTKQEYIEKLSEYRARVWDAVEGLNDEQLSEPMGEGKWSIKDTLGHLAAWEGEAVHAFEQKARGERPTIGDITDFDAWNEVESGKRKDWSPDQIRQELKGNRDRLMEIVAGIPEDEKIWASDRATARILGTLINHDRHHLEGIRRHVEAR